MKKDLADAKAAIVELSEKVGDLEAHERLVAAEVIDDGLGADGVSDDIAGLSEQLGTSRIDALEDGASASCTDICVTDEELALTLADYATDAEVAPLATRVEMEAGDEAERQWVLDQDYLTSADLSAYATTGWVYDQDFATVFYVDTQDALLLQSQQMGDAAERQWVVDQHYATETWVEGRGYVTDADLDPYATDADLAALAGRVSMIEGDYLQAADVADMATQTWVAANYPEQAELDAAVAILDDHEARIEALEAVNLPARLAAVESAISDLQLDLGGYARVISADTTIRVPTDAPDIQAALDSLQDAVIDSGATVTIEVEPAGCGATYTAPIVARHRDGAQVHIVSQAGDPALCVLRFEATTAGLVVDAGYTLGEFSGFTVTALDPQEGAHGLLVNIRAALLTATSVVAEQWSGHGLSVQNQSYVNAFGFAGHDNVHSGAGVEASSMAILQDTRLTHNGQHGLYASAASYVYAPNADASDNTLAGLVAERSSTLLAFAATASGNGNEGLYASSGSWLDVDHAVTEDNGADGLYVVEGAGAEFGNGISQGNRAGLSAWGSGWISASAATLTENRADGAYASSGSVVYGAGVASNLNGGAGFYIVDGSFLNAPNAVAEDNHGSGFLAAGGSGVEAGAGHADRNGGDGYIAADGSYLGAEDAAATSNAGTGFQAQRGSHLFARGANVTNTGTYGFTASDGSSAFVPDASTVGGRVGFAAGNTSFVNASGSTSDQAASEGFNSAGGSYMFANGSTATQYGYAGFTARGLSGIDLDDATATSTFNVPAAFADRMSWLTIINATLSGDVLPPAGTQSADNSATWDP